MGETAISGIADGIDTQTVTQCESISSELLSIIFTLCRQMLQLFMKYKSAFDNLIHYPTSTILNLPESKH